MKEAFCYMFKDNKIKEKMALFFGIAFISNICSNIAQEMAKTSYGVPDLNVILLILAGIVVGFVTAGYGIACNRAIIEQKENVVLPFISVWRNLCTGFKMTVSITIMVILLTLIMIPFAILSVLVSKVIMSLYVIAAVIFLVSTATAFTYIFSKTDSWISFIKIKTAFKLISESKWQYWSRVLVMAGVSILNAILGSIISEIAGSTIVGITISTILVCIISSYLVYVFANLVANCAKEPELQNAE